MKPLRWTGPLAAALLAVGAAADTDAVLERTSVPNRLLKQGEVRLVRRGEALVVQVALDAGHIDKVRAKIVEAENRNWAEDHPQRADRKAFTQALDRTVAEQKKRGDSRTCLLIEFSEGGNPSFFDPVYGKNLAVEKKTLLCEVPASATYVRENMELILMDAFAWSPDEASRILRGHGWSPTQRLEPTP